jgi:hypothetical protein
MGMQFYELVQALAVAQAGPGLDPDPTTAEVNRARTLRRRIAGLISVPSGIGMLYLAAWANSVVVGVVGYAVLAVALWRFAERGDRIAAWIQRPRSATQL